jgi:methionyl aminopeptidase
MVLDDSHPPRQRSGMITIYSGNELPKLRSAGRVAAQTLETVCAKLTAGVTTAEIERWVRADTKQRGGKPSQLGFHGFPHAVCISRNHVVCHGMPSERERLANGDIVNVDVTTEVDGFHGDTSRTVAIGEISEDARHVMETAERCRDAGISVIRDGARIGDLGAAIVEVARANGCSVVRDLCGHGIGRHMHEDPKVPHVGRAGMGLRLREGMVITVEPMINLGGPEVVFHDDGWTVTTADGSLSAQFEHTVLVTKQGFEIMTLPE